MNARVAETGQRLAGAIVDVKRARDVLGDAFSGLTMAEKVGCLAELGLVEEKLRRVVRTIESRA